jgi:transcriptional regulator with XRE-family HTH domain
MVKTSNTAKALVAERAAASLQRSGLSENAAATASGIPRSTLRRFLAGVDELTPGRLYALAIALGAEMGDWLKGAYVR